MTSLLVPRPAAPALRRAVGRSAEGRTFAAFWGCLVAVDVTRGLPGGTHSVGGLVAVALVVALAAHGQSPAVAVALAVLGWLFVTGFVVHAGGLLRVDGPADAVRLLVLAAATLLARHLPRTGRTR